MKTTLMQANSTPGVIGSLVCDFEGRLIVEAIPALIEKSLIAAVLDTIRENSVTLKKSDGGIKKFDVRDDDISVIVKSYSGGVLLLFCCKDFSGPIIQVAMNITAKRLEISAASWAEAQTFKAVEITEAPPKPASTFVMPMNISPFGNFAAETHQAVKDKRADKPSRFFEFTMPREW